MSNVNCLDLIKGNEKLEKHFESITDLSNVEQRAKAVELAKEYYKGLHNELEGFKKKLNPEYKPKKFVPENTDAKVAAVKEKYAPKPTPTVSEPTQDSGGDERFTAKGGNKAVDDKGEPLELYHGTSKAFDNLDDSKTKRGLFFSSNKKTASSYANTGGDSPKIISVHLDIKNPHIIDAKGKSYDEIMVDLDKVDMATGKGVSKKMSTDEIVEALRGMRSEKIITNLYGTKTKADGIIIKNVKDALTNNLGGVADVYIPFKNEQVKRLNQPLEPTTEVKTGVTEEVQPSPIGVGQGNAEATPSVGDTVTVISRTDNKPINYIKKEDGWHFEDSRGKMQKASPKEQVSVTGDWREAQGLPRQTILEAGKATADFIRTLRPPSKTTQSNILGLPIAIYDTAIVVIANAVEAGASVAQAVADWVKDYKAKNPNWKQEKEFAKQVGEAAQVYNWVTDTIKSTPDITVEEIMDAIAEDAPQLLEGERRTETEALVRGLVEGSGTKVEAEEEVEEDEEYVDIDNATEKTLDEITASVEGSGVIKQYMSGESIEYHQNEKPTNDQDYEAVELQKASEQGKNIVEVAKKLYGEKYVAKLLDYAKTKVISNEVKALIYVTLEKYLATEKAMNPERATEISQLQNLVWTESQAHARSNSIALGMMRLRDLVKYGVSAKDVMDKIFSSGERKARNKVSKAAQATPEQVNKQQEEGAKNKEAKAKKDAEIAKVGEEAKAKKKDSPKKDSRPKSKKEDWALVAQKKTQMKNMIDRLRDKINKLDC